MKYRVTARAFNRITGEPIATTRREIIDTQNNHDFIDCKSILDVKHAYEFWNKLNPCSQAIIFVSRINLIKKREV